MTFQEALDKALYDYEPVDLARTERLLWQSIETAPKDGTVVLLVRAAKSAYPPYSGRWNDDREDWEGYIEGIGDTVDPPTHWMPLPEAPKP